jgi:hypothetical protein
MVVSLSTALQILPWVLSESLQKPSKQTPHLAQPEESSNVQQQMQADVQGQSTPSPPQTFRNEELVCT